MVGVVKVFRGSRADYSGELWVFVVVVFLLDASEFPLFLLEPWVFASRWGVFQWGGRYLVCQVYFIFMVLGDFFRGNLSSPC